jgi:hypothetical protein
VHLSEQNYKMLNKLALDTIQSILANDQISEVMKQHLINEIKEDYRFQVKYEQPRKVSKDTKE